jgi:hypothetical protein
MASSTHDAVAPNGAGEAYDRRLAAEAVRKMARGEPLTVREQTALKRYEKERDENLRWKHYASIPQKHWRRMSGRQTKVINEQAVLYGIPFGGPTVRQGGGSRGGRVESIQFLNGATLKFMSGGGSDNSRAGFTSRVVVVTETDGMDESGGTSREADKITQLEARTRAYGHRKHIYLECTASTEEGRTWREYQQGTASRIVLCCPHCGDWVSPEREHLVGWKEAATRM